MGQLQQVSLEGNQEQQEGNITGNQPIDKGHVVGENSDSGINDPPPKEIPTNTGQDQPREIPESSQQ